MELLANYVASCPACRTKYPHLHVAIVMKMIATIDR
jgi:hypothetical protein